MTQMPPLDGASCDCRGRGRAVDLFIIKKRNAMATITPFLWFNDNAEAAVNRYMEIFSDGRILSTARNPQNGQVMVISFSIQGQELTAMNGGPAYRLTEAFSLVVHCKDQAEVDYYWDALVANGGTESRCGWLKDAFGLSWQIVPEQLPKLMAQPDAAAAGRVMQALMGMKRIVIRNLEQAANE